MRENNGFGGEFSYSQVHKICQFRRRPFFESYLPFTQFTPYFPGMHFSHAVPVKLAEHWQCPFPDIPSPHWPLLEQGLLRLPGQANIETIIHQYYFIMDH